MMKTRCQWCGYDALYMHYHDNEWAVPLHDDRHLFEMLILEGAQAGLNWLTILKKRDNYRQALDYFDYEKIAGYTSQDIEGLLTNTGIVRNRLKLESTVKNARATLAIIEEMGSLDAFFWRYVDNMPIQNQWKSIADIPTKTLLSDKVSKALKQRGFNFVGPTICYAFMQAIGMVNDHTIDCFRYNEINRMQ